MPYEFKLPDIGEGVVEGEIVRWLVAPGDTLDEDQAMVEIMTDKATVELPSPVSGKVLKTLGSEGDVVSVGSTLVVIDAAGQVPAKAGKDTSQPSSHNSQRATDKQPSALRSKADRQLATPAVRRFAREKGVDLTTLAGTAAGGRITRADVEKALEESARATQKPVEGDAIPYRGLRKKIGDHLVASKRFAPHYSYVDEVDATQLVQLRSEFQRLHEGEDLTYLPFIVKACVSALQKYPLLNATLDEEKKVIRLKSEYNIGIATATEEGLIVPVVKGADGKNVMQLSAEIQSLADQARTGKARLEDLKDGTFTITSLGALGGLLATPIINYPEVAILGVHKIAERPVVRDGRIVIRNILNLSLSLDHRVVDGAVGAAFLHHIISLIENPGLLALS